MEFFNSNIKNFLTFFQEKAFLKFPEIEPSSKNKKIHPKKNFLYFRKWKPWKNLYFLNRKLLRPSLKTKKPALKKFIICSKKTFLIFPEIELSSLKVKKFQEVTFQARKVKISYILGNFWNFLDLSLKNFLYFRMER